MGKFHEKSNILNKKLRKSNFCKCLSLDQFQNVYQNIDGADCFHQHIQSSHVPIPLNGLTFNLVMFGICLHTRTLVSSSSSSCFDPDVQYSTRRCAIAPPTINQ